MIMYHIKTKCSPLVPQLHPDSTNLHTSPHHRIRKNYSPWAPPPPRPHPHEHSWRPQMIMYHIKTKCSPLVPQLHPDSTNLHTSPHHRIRKNYSPWAPPPPRPHPHEHSWRPQMIMYHIKTKCSPLVPQLHPDSTNLHTSPHHRIRKNYSPWAPPPPRPHPHEHSWRPQMIMFHIKTKHSPLVPQLHPGSTLTPHISTLSHQKELFSMGTTPTPTPPS